LIVFLPKPPAAGSTFKRISTTTANVIEDAGQQRFVCRREGKLVSHYGGLRRIAYYELTVNGPTKSLRLVAQRTKIRGNARKAIRRVAT